jgi:hypothetical protein
MNVPLRLLDLDEAVAHIKTIRAAAAKRTDAHREPSGVGLFEEQGEHRGADASALVRGQHVQVIEQERAGTRFDRDEPDTRARNDDVPRESRFEAALKSLARPLRIEAANALEATLHGLDPEREQRLEITRARREQSDVVQFMPSLRHALEVLVGAQGLEA